MPAACRTALGNITQLVEDDDHAIFGSTSEEPNGESRTSSEKKLLSDFPFSGSLGNAAKFPVKGVHDETIERRRNRLGSRLATTFFTRSQTRFETHFRLCDLSTHFAFA